MRKVTSWSANVMVPVRSVSATSSVKAALMTFYRLAELILVSVLVSRKGTP